MKHVVICCLSLTLSLYSMENNPQRESLVSQKQYKDFEQRLEKLENLFGNEYTNTRNNFQDTVFLLLFLNAQTFQLTNLYNKYIDLEQEHKKVSQDLATHKQKVETLEAQLKQDKERSNSDLDGFREEQIATFVQVYDTVNTLKINLRKSSEKIEALEKKSETGQHT